MRVIILQVTIRKRALHAQMSHSTVCHMPISSKKTRCLIDVISTQLVSLCIKGTHGGMCGFMQAKFTCRMCMFVQVSMQRYVCVCVCLTTFTLQSLGTCVCVFVHTTKLIILTLDRYEIHRDLKNQT